MAARDSELSFISRSSFEAVAEKNPEVFRLIVRLLARRLRDTNNVVAAMSFHRLPDLPAGDEGPGYPPDVRLVRYGRD